VSRGREELSPLEAYELAERQKHRLGEAFRGKVFRLHRALAADGPPPGNLPGELWRGWREACRTFAAAPAGDQATIAGAYRDVVMRYGLKRIDPASRSFGRDLREFHCNYVASFPLPEEQESRQGFRDLWKAPLGTGGYEEVGYSVLCPLTGRYIMGLNFTIQPQSDSVHFVYGFVNPIARLIGGFSARLIGLMRDVARRRIASHLERHPADRPPYHSGGDPLILFEKNVLNEMTLTEILRDTARTDIDRPPRRGARLIASAVSQSFRDLVWDRRGGRVIDYNYMQSSLDGVVRVPEAARSIVIAHLNRAPLSTTKRQQAARVLAECLGRRAPGCVTLNLCAFADPGTQSLPAAQVRRSNEIFQGVSVVKDPEHVAEDIYFQAQMASLSARALDGTIALRPIPATGSGGRDFHEAERTTRRLLASVTWAELREGRDRTYGEWVQQKAHVLAEP
jgi:hypothetical protein